MNSAISKEPKSALERHGLRPKRSFGQNFLTNSHLAEKIAELSTSPEGGTVVEIGCGLGALTIPLLARANTVIGVERDRDMVRALETDFADHLESGRFRLLEADAKSIDVVELLRDASCPRVLAGNLPYQITGLLIELATRSAPILDRAVFLVQLEVADRIVARPSTAAYGALSVFVQAQFEPSRAFVVKRGAFYPQPNVDSAVVVFLPRPSPVSETETFRRLVKAAFSMRRKKLSNAWGRSLGLADGELSSAAARCGIDLGARGETLSADQFGAMALELDR